MSLETRIVAFVQAVAADIKALRTGLAGKAASGANTDITSITGSAAKLTTPRSIKLIGDGSGSVNFDGSLNVELQLTLSNSGVTAGTYAVSVVDAKGRVTGGRSLQAADLPKTGMPEGTWGVVATDVYGRVTAGRSAVASDITGGTFAIGRLPVVGSVSQFNGQPTGAIIETGTNANGTYIRYADGTQICHSLVGSGASQVTQQASVGFHQYVGMPTYPASFVTPPRVMLGLAQASYYYGAAMTDAPASTTQTGSIYLWSPANSFRGQAAYIAIGRWF